MSELVSDRLNIISQWVRDYFVAQGVDLPESPAFERVSGDASFRCYYRTMVEGQSYIVVDAPPEHEDSRPFVGVATSFKAAGLNVPEVYHADYELGAMLLSDLGDDLLWPALNHQSVDALYHQAMNQLLILQQCQSSDVWQFPEFNEARLLKEMNLFREWFTSPLLGLELSDQEQEMLDKLFNGLVGSAQQQPQVCVHLDYHSRNLMLDAKQQMSIIDFQDAVIGPITYDLVSLLRDCYIEWPIEKVEAWVTEFGRQLHNNHRIDNYDEALFLRWFDLMGMQRHIKVLGIFARLNIRDGKTGYMNDIPLTYRYLRQVAGKYAQFNDFVDFLDQRILPAMQANAWFENARLTS